MLSFRLIVTLIVCFLPIQSDAAGPIMHIALSERYLSAYATNYSEDEKRLFLLGSLFPDIRYLGVIKREESHFKGVTLARVNQEKSPFKRGMLFHSFVDEQRLKMIQQTGIEKKIQEVSPKLRGIFLKLIEDQILHPQSDWIKIRTYLISIPDEEKTFGINLQALTEWHTGLSIYFTTLPSLILTQISLLDKNVLMLDASTIKLWSVLLPQYADKPLMQVHVKKIMEGFDKMLEKH